MIKALGLGKRYGRHWVFRGGELELNGRSAAVVRPNGSGKPILLKILALLIEPDGELLLGHDRYAPQGTRPLRSPRASGTKRRST